jgi:predicted outer membrane protein
MNRKFTCILLLLCLASAFCAPPEKKDVAEIIDQHDIDLVSTLYQSNLYAIKVSEEALTRSTYKETKELAKNLIAESEKLKSVFDVLMGRKAVDMPLDISESQLNSWQSIVKIKGWDFDKTYLEKSIGLKAREIAVLTKISTDAKNEEIKNIALDLLKDRNNIAQLRLKVEEIMDSRIRKDSALTASSFIKE